MYKLINSDSLLRPQRNAFSLIYMNGSTFVGTYEETRILKRCAAKFHRYMIANSAYYESKLAAYIAMHKPGSTVDIGAV
jgi:hypothetical protein